MVFLLVEGKKIQFHHENGDSKAKHKESLLTGDVICNRNNCLRDSSNSRIKPKERTGGIGIFRSRVQAKKSTGRMPWHREPTKDVTTCDKLR